MANIYQRRRNEKQISEVSFGTSANLHLFTYYWTIFYYWTICQGRNFDQLTDLVVLTAVFHLT